MRNPSWGLPSELALSLVMDIDTGAPVAIVDATAITAMRTGAVTAIGARYLADRTAGARSHRQPGHGLLDIRLLCRVLPDLRRSGSTHDERRAASSRPGRGEGHRSPRAAVDSWEEAVRGADVVVEATRLPAPEPLLHTDWIRRGARIPYGTISAIELLAHRRHGRNRGGRLEQARAGPLGALRAHVESGRLTRDSLHAELGQIVCGARPGRQTSGETWLFWHRGLSISDLAVGLDMLEPPASAGGYGAPLPH